MSQIGQILALLRPYWRYLAQSLLVAVMVTVLSLPGPYLTKLLVDDVYPHQDYGLLYFLLVLGAVTSTFLGLTSAASGLFGQQVSLGMSLDFQSRLYRHIQELDFSFFDRRETGEIMSRFDDLQASVSGVIGLMDSLVLNGLKVLVFPAVLFAIEWRLALIALAVLPFDTVLASVSGRVQSRYSRRIAEQSAELSAKTVESLSNVRTVQALRLEGVFHERLLTLLQRVAQTRVRATAFGGGIGFAADIVRLVGSTAFAWYGWSHVLGGSLSLGTFLAFSAYVGYLYGPISGLISLWPEVQMVRVRIDRFLEVYAREPSIRDGALDLPGCTLAGEIRFEQVWFGYGEEPVLRGVDLTIGAGATVALIGMSGAGKSTMAKLIPRFYDPDAGRVMLDGVDVREYRLEGLRTAVVSAMQGSGLFQGTVLDNLTFGREIPMRDVEAAARSACIHDDIAALPEGYATVMGEHGAGVSEGQKQRLALARVLLLDAPVVILDEPTAALDQKTEMMLRDTLAIACEGRTTIIITHRPEAIQAADEVVALVDGRVVEGAGYWPGADDCSASPPSRLRVSPDGETRGVSEHAMLGVK